MDIPNDLISQGQHITLNGNQPLLLSNSNLFYVLLEGQIDIFAVELFDTTIIGQRHYLFTIDPHTVFNGLDIFASESIGIMGVGAFGTHVVQLSNTQILEKFHNNDSSSYLFQNGLEIWISKLSQSVIVNSLPKDLMELKPNIPLTIQPNQNIAMKAPLTWVSVQSGEALWGGYPEAALSKNIAYPIAKSAWIWSQSELHLTTFKYQEGFSKIDLIVSLSAFYQFILQLIRYQMATIQTKNKTQLQEQMRISKQQNAQSLFKLSKILNPQLKVAIPQQRESPLMTVCKRVGKQLNIKIAQTARLDISLDEIASLSKIRYRKVLLQDQWYKTDCGPLIGFWESTTDAEETKAPIAILPLTPSQYQLYDPKTDTYSLITNELSNKIEPFAYTFYRSFPIKPLSLINIGAFGVKGLKKDTLLLLSMALATGLLALAIPISSQLIFDTIIPRAELGPLIQLILILATIQISSALFQIVKGLAQIRLETKIDATIQAGIWDRLINLPVAFFRQFSSGDLAQRANAILNTRAILTGSTTETILSSIFSIISLILLFFYDFRLACAGVGLALIASIISILFWRSQYQFQMEIADKSGLLSGWVIQMINGISKIRIAAAESRIFSLWASQFSKIRKLTFRASLNQNIFTVFTTSYPIISMLILYALYLYWKETALTINQQFLFSTGKFLAFMAAFSQFQTAFLNLTIQLNRISNAIPLLNRLDPILKEIPETDSGKMQPDELNGSIEISHVSFQYQRHSALVLNDTTFQVNPGEFVALVGPSGSGKSTLLRLLLGFEKPLSGSIYYNGQNMEDLDLQALRRQIGVVLQNSKIIPGDIFSNIIGAHNLTLDDAWQAARWAGLDKDIEEMPMGMHTFISEGASTLSGGQRQRLMIARALVNKPRIIFFDEATSALDNITQSIVTESLEHLKTTRIVIAHRLTTIQKADQIYVMQAGKIVESGTFERLMKHKTVLYELMHQQMV